MIIKDPEDSSVVYNVSVRQLTSIYKDSEGKSRESNENTIMYELMMRGVDKDFYEDEKKRIICLSLVGHGLNINIEDILSGRSYLNTHRIVK